MIYDPFLRKGPEVEFLFEILVLLTNLRKLHKMHLNCMFESSLYLTDIISWSVGAEQSCGGLSDCPSLVCL